MEFNNKKCENIYNDLEKQIDSIARHNRQGAYKTKQRYYEANQRFANYLANEWQVRKFANISDKHVQGYVEHMKKNDWSASTIKTDLSAIRFFHAKTEHKHEISDNSKFDLEQRVVKGVDRAWNSTEYDNFKQVCSKYNNQRADDVSTLARTMGLRIHEAMRISRSDVENALRTGELHVTGKNGRERDVPVSGEARDVFERKLEEVERGQKLFVDADQKTHEEIHKLQNFLSRHREQWQEERADGDPNLSFHGLRHAYARDRYDDYVKRGFSDSEAKLMVSELLGHSREEITDVYLGKK